MTPAPPLIKSPLPHNIDPSALLDCLTDPNLPIIEIARELGVTVAQILDAAEHPIITSIMSRLNRLDRQRAKRALAAAAPAAIQTLDLLTIDRSASPETRRKAATKILTITAQPRKRRTSPWKPSPIEAKARAFPPLPTEEDVDPQTADRVSEPVQVTAHQPPFTPLQLSHALGARQILVPTETGIAQSCGQINDVIAHWKNQGEPMPAFYEKAKAGV